MITYGVDHIAIAVTELEDSIKLFEIITGKICESQEIIEKQEIVSAHFNLNGVNIELISPLSSNCPLARFLAKKGEGLHHIALSVPNTDNALTELQERDSLLLIAIVKLEQIKCVSVLFILKMWLIL